MRVMIFPLYLLIVLNFCLSKGRYEDALIGVGLTDWLFHTF